jgi:hypothetical protein
VRWLAYTSLVWLTLWQARTAAGAFIYFQF